MKTSRIQGVLIFDIEKPYKIAINGSQEERTEIICKDIDSKVEYTACDLEQLLITALTSLQGREIETPKAQMAKDQKDDELFYDDDSPSLEEIDKRSNAIQLMVKTSKAVKMSELLETFYPIACSRIFCAGDIPMTEPIWKSISMKDKQKLLFRYCTFFVNPLEVVLDMALSMDNPELSEANND